MSDDLTCSGCGEHAGSPIADRIEQLESERDHYVNKLMEACNSYTDMHLRIEELEAENKRLNEQMDAIEEMGTESLNALPDCLMRLAPALVENDELKAKLAKAVEALEGVQEFVRDLEPYADQGHTLVPALRDACTTLAKIKGEADE